MRKRGRLVIEVFWWLGTLFAIGLAVWLYDIWYDDNDNR